MPSAALAAHSARCSSPSALHAAPSFCWISPNGASGWASRVAARSDSAYSMYDVGARFSFSFFSFFLPPPPSPPASALAAAAAAATAFLPAAVPLGLGVVAALAMGVGVVGGAAASAAAALFSARRSSSSSHRGASSSSSKLTSSRGRPAGSTRMSSTLASRKAFGLLLRGSRARTRQ